MLVPGPSPKFVWTWTGDRPQGLTVAFNKKKIIKKRNKRVKIQFIKRI